VLEENRCGPLIISLPFGIVRQNLCDIKVIIYTIPHGASNMLLVTHSELYEELWKPRFQLCVLRQSIGLLILTKPIFVIVVP